MQVDTRNPTAGQANTLLLKDANLTTTNAGNCVLYYGGGNFAADFARLQALSHGLFFAPPGGTGALKGSGIAHAAFGTCYAATSAADPFYALSLNNPAMQALLAATHFATSNPAIGGTLTPPSGRWWLQVYAKNLGDSAGINGEYLSGATSGLYTGVFYTDPRTYGLAIHASL